MLYDVVCDREEKQMDSMFKVVQQHKEVSLSERVAQQISELIKERNIAVGDKLPNEFELAENLNVGRGTIREAIKILVARNCLEIRRGKGTYVTEEIGRVDDPLGFEFVTDKIKLAEELYEIRSHLEPWIASLAARRIQEDEKEELRKHCKAVEDKIRAGEDHGEVDVAFHQYIAACTHNSVLKEMIPIITYSVQLFTRDREPEALQNTIESHSAITRAICANDPEWARRAMMEHTESNLRSINLLKINQREAEEKTESENNPV